MPEISLALGYTDERTLAHNLRTLRGLAGACFISGPKLAAPPKGLFVTEGPGFLHGATLTELLRVCRSQYLLLAGGSAPFVYSAHYIKQPGQLS
jgi:hypothetical protein